MSPTIKISPEEVRQVAKKFETASAQSNEVVSNLRSTMSNLQPNWEGLASQRFYQEYEQWNTSMKGYVDLLNRIGQELRTIATVIEEADRKLAK